MRIQVIRHPGDIQAKAIINKYACTEVAGLEIGRNFLDENGFDKMMYDVATPFRVPPLPGSICEIMDSGLGKIFKTKIVSFTLTGTMNTDTAPAEIQLQFGLERSLTE